MSYGLLFDQNLCLGCGACALACQSEHDQQPHIPTRLDEHSFTYVEKIKDVFFQRHLCMHCENPTCLSVCPVGAFTKTKEGAVIYNSTICLGCRYCVMACPFHIPKYEWHSYFPRVRKCDFCYHRTSKGLPTACAEACPTGATLFGERAKLLEIAKERIKKNPDDYQPYIYGEKEGGGTSVFMIMKKPIAETSLYANIPDKSLPQLTWNVLGKLPVIIPVWGVFLGGMYYLTKRKNDISKEGEDKSDGN